MRFIKAPFTRHLFKLSASIFVGWNVFVVSIMVSTFVFAIFLVAIGTVGSVGMPAEDSLGDFSYMYGDSYSLNKLLVIPIKGEIVGDSVDDGFFSDITGVTSGYHIKQKLFDAAQRPEVKGVLLAIDSPGGTIYGSRAIADGVKYYQLKTGQPVFAHVQGLGASGAYMAAAPATNIAADYGTEIGSIGIVMGPFKYYDGVLSESGSLLESGVLTQNGIEHVVLSAGKSKDIGSPYRRLTNDERSQLQKSINNEYDQFVNLVSEYRSIDREVIKDKIGAMIYDPATAKSLGLIDQVQDRESTYAALAQAANIQDYQVVEEMPVYSFFESALGAFGKKPQKEAKPYDTCTLTQTKLAYHGSVPDLCK
jgi:protease IV